MLGRSSLGAVIEFRDGFPPDWLPAITSTELCYRISDHRIWNHRTRLTSFPPLAGQLATNGAVGFLCIGLW